MPAKEWMRICFELLDLLKAHKKAIRRAAVNSFGYIAKAIGPQDVLAVLLTNLKVQERTVACVQYRRHRHCRRDMGSLHVYPGHSE